MAMLRVHILVVLNPFLQASVFFADLQRREFFQRGFALGTESGIGVQDFNCLTGE